MIKIRMTETRDELLQGLADHFRDAGDAMTAFNIEEKMGDFKREGAETCEECKDGYCVDCDEQLPPQQCAECVDK